MFLPNLLVTAAFVLFQPERAPIGTRGPIRNGNCAVSVELCAASVPRNSDFMFTQYSIQTEAFLCLGFRLLDWPLQLVPLGVMALLHGVASTLPQQLISDLQVCFKILLSCIYHDSTSLIGVSALL